MAGTCSTAGAFAGARFTNPYDFGRTGFWREPASTIACSGAGKHRGVCESLCPVAAEGLANRRFAKPAEEEEPDLEAPPTELREIVAQVEDLLSCYWDVDTFGERPLEDEMVAHYVVPFLRALGWAVERIAVKWRNIDVSVFSALPRIPEHCHYLIEAKRLGAGVEGALEQATGYVSALGVQCDVVVTDGIRYRMYEASKDFVPVAYANLARMKQSSLELFARMRRP